MANRRMISQTVIDSDAFLSLDPMSRLLYYELAARADDDGLCNKMIFVMLICKASETNLTELINKGFLIRFDSGVCAIVHWYIHNQVRKDRYHASVYKTERDALVINRNHLYMINASLASGYSACQKLIYKADTYAGHVITVNERFGTKDDYNDIIDITAEDDNMKLINMKTANAQPNGNHNATNCQPNGNQNATNSQSADNSSATNNQPLDNQMLPQSSPNQSSREEYNIDHINLPNTADKIRTMLMGFGVDVDSADAMYIIDHCTPLDVQSTYAKFCLINRSNIRNPTKYLTTMLKNCHKRLKPCKTCKGRGIKQSAEPINPDDPNSKITYKEYKCPDCGGLGFI